MMLAERRLSLALSSAVTYVLSEDGLEIGQLQAGLASNFIDLSSQRHMIDPGESHLSRPARLWRTLAVGALRKTFTLTNPAGDGLAQARQTGAETFGLEFAGHSYRAAPKNFPGLITGMTFFDALSGVAIGEISSSTGWRTTLAARLPEDWSAAVRAFSLWMYAYLLLLRVDGG